MRVDSRTWAVALALFAPSVWGEEMKSGPDVGKTIPVLKVFAVTGELEGKDVDYAAERKKKPTIYALIRADQWGRPMARFLKTLDKEVKKDSEDAFIVAVWLTDKHKETKEYLPRAQESLQFENTALAYFKGKKDGPKGWNVNSDAHITVVVVNNKKVAARFGYMSINETEVKNVRVALKKALKAKK
jgi:hypothetical protein